MATLQLASWATNLTYANLTTGVLTAANKSFYNWAGCAIGGFASQPAPQIALNTTLSPFSGPPTSSILGANGSIALGFADAQVAALVNGIASHVDDYDDTHLETIIHPAGPVASALLAIAEAMGPVSGQDFMTAFVAGVEAECKLGLSVYPQHYDVGWHITSTTGSIGAAVAVSKLLRLDTPHTAQAIGIASTQVIGMQVFFGSDTKAFHIGRAAQSGLLAALLAQNGYTSADTALEAKYGWLHVTREKGLDVADVKAIELRVNPEVLVLTGKTAPTTGLEAKFSIYHAAAIGLLYGEATPSQFTDEVVRNSTVVDMRTKVNVTEDEEVPTDAAYVSVEFSDGTTLDKHVEHAKGSLENPLSEAELKTKFMEQVTLAIGEARAERAYEAFTNAGGMEDVGRIRGMY
ncbi:2-methylcitrate dehydratase PrpD [Trematosphaeria pertusa]|uniref:2-methylcitrate dehydratase PrpD n=1 Tax=Trematosphaeria pertusa TaxID=390896 RepID=A0A6A6HSM2_9PLEO|nr:2-methylcitrate dehydratase PrpD [Trematosphaeria pertusa]KAF2241011.1 2-methylcitrate dehydratase PrpD [Trematosphaeria pertusa]